MTRHLKEKHRREASPSGITCFAIYYIIAHNFKTTAQVVNILSFNQGPGIQPQGRISTHFLCAIQGIAFKTTAFQNG
jgi:hypothetical protein